MKKMILCLLALCLAMPLASAAAPVTALTHQEVKARIDSNPYLNLIDTRSLEEYEEGHPYMAIHMPLDTIEVQMQGILDGGFSYMEAEMILLGHDTEQVKHAAETVSRLGFTNVSYTADMESWPYELIDINEENARMQRLFGGMDAQDINGNSVRENIFFDSKLTMVNVWATYCNNCIDEMPELGEFARSMQARGVQVIGIVTDTLGYYWEKNDDNIALAQEIVQNTQADYLHLVPDMVMVRNLLPQISAVPTTFFLDQQGNLVGGVYLGARGIDFWEATVQELLSQLPQGDTAQ